MTPTLNQTEKTLVLVSAIVASSMAFIDGTALNVALPALQRSLDLKGSQLLWIVNGYTLFLAALMLIAGSLGDVFGKKRIFMFGITCFTICSIVCGFSPSGNFLIVARCLQGIGGAFMVPGSLALITASFPQEERGKAIGTWSMFSAFTTILGPVLGGYLAGEGLWRMIFFLNVPLGILSLLLLWFKVREPSPIKNIHPDWWGGLFSTLALSGIAFGFIQASEKGFGVWWIWLSIASGLIFFMIFLKIEKRINRPMLPLALFDSSTFSGANLMTLFVYGALSLVLFFIPLNLIQIQGYPEKLAGLAILPFGGLIAILARTSGKWTDRIGAKTPLIIGPLITGLSFLSMSWIGITDGFTDFWTTFFPALLLGGVGMGLTVVPLTTAVMNCVTDENAGIASGVNNTISRLANVLTLAIFGAFALLYFQDDLAESIPNLDLSAQQTEYLLQNSDQLAETAAPDSWGAETQTQVRQRVQQSFINTFNLLCIITSLLCAAGAFISWRMISGRPKTVHLD